MSTKPHIADAEVEFKVVNVTPDFCKVDGDTVPFEIKQTLAPEKAFYAKNVHARGGRVLTMGSVIEGVIGNMGEGVISGVAQGSGHIFIAEGDETVLTRGSPTARHDHKCLMNCKL